MKERGIIFSDWEVRAILAGRKTMFRRAIKPQPEACNHADYKGLGAEWWDKPSEFYEIHPGQWACRFCGNGTRLSRRDVLAIPCPFGTVGDRLYGREAWMSVDTSFRQPAKFRTCTDLHGRSHTIVYRADANYSCDWNSPVTMPRWASRITLEIVNVRVERVQDITEQDAIAEGCDGNCPVSNVRTYQAGPFSYQFAQLWDSIHGPAAWDRNDWVWAVTFKRLEGGAKQPPEESK